MTVGTFRWRGPDRNVDGYWLGNAVPRAPNAPVAALVCIGGGGGISAAPVITATAQADIFTGAAVALNRANGHALLGDPAYKPNAFVVGLAVAAVASGFPVQIQTGLFSLPDWTAVAGTATLTPGLPYFLGAGGTITSAPPSAPDCVTLIGLATGPTTLSINPDPPLQL